MFILSCSHHSTEQCGLTTLTLCQCCLVEKFSVKSDWNYGITSRTSRLRLASFVDRGVTVWLYVPIHSKSMRYVYVRMCVFGKNNVRTNTYGPTLNSCSAQYLVLYRHSSLHPGVFVVQARRYWLRHSQGVWKCRSLSVTVQRWRKLAMSEKTWSPLLLSCFRTRTTTLTKQNKAWCGINVRQ